MLFTHDITQLHMSFYSFTYQNVYICKKFFYLDMFPENFKICLLCTDEFEEVEVRINIKISPNSPCFITSFRVHMHGLGHSRIFPNGVYIYFRLFFFIKLYIYSCNISIYTDCQIQILATQIQNKYIYI